MTMIRCSQGHFFDDQKHSSCPWCGVANLDLTSAKQAGMEQDETPRTVALGKDQRNFAFQAQPEAEGKTFRLNEKADNAASFEGRTVAFVKKKSGVDPVVGWLVCVEGAEKGRDYRIHTEKNSIGRAENMDIVLKGDDTISRENHAYVVFNPKKKTFRVQGGEGRGLIYVNDNEVISAQELQPYDAIEIGQGKYVFVPFCGDAFDWEAGGAVEGQE